MNHGDTNILNFVDDGRRAGLIDITEPTYGWYAMEMVDPFGDYGISREDRRVLWSRFLSGYCSCRPVDIDFESVVWLLRRGTLDLFVHFLPDNPPDNRKDWMKVCYRYVSGEEKW